MLRETNLNRLKEENFTISGRASSRKRNQSNKKVINSKFNFSFNKGLSKYKHDSHFIFRKTEAQRAAGATKAPELQHSSLWLGAWCFCPLWVYLRAQTALETSWENGPSAVPRKPVSEYETSTALRLAMTREDDENGSHAPGEVWVLVAQWWLLIRTDVRIQPPSWYKHINPYDAAPLQVWQPLLQASKNAVR